LYNIFIAFATQTNARRLSAQLVFHLI